MRTKAFQQFLAQITKLTPTQRKQVLDNIQKMDNTEIVEDVLNTTDHCHYCGSNNFIKWGLNSNIQRYKCKDCKKTFNALTKTPMAHLRYKDKWNDFSKDLIDSKSVRNSATHCHISKSTSFRWRHRFLKIPAGIKAKHLQGIVEFDKPCFAQPPRLWGVNTQQE